MANVSTMNPKNPGDIEQSSHMPDNVPPLDRITLHSRTQDSAFAHSELGMTGMCPQ